MDYDYSKIENTKLEIRLAFVESKTNGRNNFVLTKGFDNEKIWERAAKLCLYFNIEPKELVNIVAKHCNKKNIIMMQHHLVGLQTEKLIRDYVQEKKINKIDSIEKYVDKAISFAETLLHAQKDFEYVLKSPSNAIEPWLRLYLGKNTHCYEEIKEIWGERAKNQINNIDGLKEELKIRNIILDI